MYYLKSRYYDPEVGRFITIDDISYIDPETINGLNLYAYCGNNPVNRYDSTGNSWNSFWKGVGNWFVKAGKSIGNFFTKTIPNWWNGSVVPWWNNNISPILSNVFSFDGIKHFFSGNVEGTLYAYLKNKVRNWWNNISFEIYPWTAPWMTSIENVMYNFAELIQTNPLINLVLFVGGVVLSGAGFFPGFLLSALSYGAYIVNSFRR